MHMKTLKQHGSQAFQQIIVEIEEHHIRASAIKNMTYKQSISGTPFSEGKPSCKLGRTAFRSPCTQGAEKKNY